jgi:hypothetical protein
MEFPNHILQKGFIEKLSRMNKAQFGNGGK